MVDLRHGASKTGRLQREVPRAFIVGGEVLPSHELAAWCWPRVLRLSTNTCDEMCSEPATRAARWSPMAVEIGAGKMHKPDDHDLDHIRHLSNDVLATVQATSNGEHRLRLAEAH
jgi:hypothetical protein